MDGSRTVAARRRAVLVRPLLAALLVAGSWLSTPAAAQPVVAATPDLTLVTAASYSVDVAHARIAVGVDIVATDHKADTRSYRYYFDTGYLQVFPNATGFSLTAPGLKPSVAVVRRTSGATLLRLSFGTRVYHGQPLRLHLAFALPDRGGAPTRDVRVGQALVQFPVWAFATPSTPGSSVSVAIPAGYTVQLAAGELHGPTIASDGTQVLTSGSLADPLSFFAYVTADRPGAYAESTITTTVEGGAAVVQLDAWPDDTAWAKRVGDVFGRGLPELGSAIGLPYSRSGPLVVRESVSRTLGGYAGIFDPAKGRIDVDYAADPFVVLHEASHVWFNGSLLADRWADEAFASYYGSVAAKAIKVTGGPDPLTPALEASKIPLNAWGAVGLESPEVEAYAYAATALLAQKIAERAGADGLRRVWAAAAARESAYQPLAGAPVEHLDAAPDWRGLLDLLEGLTGQRYDDLWLAYVVRPTDAPMLPRRAAARSDYAALLARASGWQLPDPIRTAMSAWQFDQAEGLISQADGVLDQRATIEAAAAAAGLTPPATLRAAFERDGGFTAAKAEADAELRTIAVVHQAIDAKPAGDDPIVTLGLIGSDPGAEMAAARAAFAAGDLATAASDSVAAQAIWDGAHDAGMRRALAIAGIVIVVLLMSLVLVRGARGRRQRRGRRLPMAHPLSAGPAPYATLAGEPPAAGPGGRHDGGGGEGSETR